MRAKLIEPNMRDGLDFYYFRLFNQAMLIMQAWRLQTNLDSLCAQVLREKYYPNGSLEDVFSGNASLTWHAIHLACGQWRKDLHIVRSMVAKTPTLPASHRTRLMSPAALG